MCISAKWISIIICIINLYSTSNRVKCAFAGADSSIVFLHVAMAECYYEAPLGVFGIRDIHGKNYRDTEYLRKKLLGYRILRSSFRDTGYSQKIVTSVV